MTDETQGADLSAAEDTAAADQVAEDQTPAQGDEQSGDDAPAATDEGQAENPKPKKSVQERINELTREKHELAREKDRDIEYWKAKALQGEVSRPAEQAQQQAPEQDQEPHPDDYEYGELDARFIRDHATHHARQAFREEMAKEKAAAERQRLDAEFKDRVKTVAERNPDFDEVVGENYANVAKLVTQTMGVVLSNIPEGPETAYHLAKNPAEARRIAALPDFAQAVEIGKLAQRLATPAKPTAKLVSDAPDPPPQARGTGGRFTVAADTDDFKAFEKQHLGG